MFNIRHINPLVSVGLLDLQAFAAEKDITAKRDVEKAGALHVLKELLSHEPFELAYTPGNKPYLAGRNEHISISHSHDKLAVIYNRQHNTGIDIELIRDKVKAIRHKFLNERELAFAQDDTEKLITFWAAKETLYKVYGLKEIDFKKHLFVDDFSGNTITGYIRTGQMNKRYALANERLDDYKLVYVLNEF